MELKDQICSLEQAKRLKEFGINQDSLFYHVQYGTEIKVVWKSYKYGYDLQWAAYTVAELGELLPDMLTTHLQYELVSIKEDDCWLIRYVRGNDMLDQHPKIKGIGGETEAQARAAMLIYLLENSLIKP